jgi:ceramide synthetase
MSHSVDTKRKDSKQMFIHHLATLGLLVGSWANNMTRNGTLVLLLHDIADPLLEIAKIFNYIRYEKLCDFFFRTFAIAFAITRLFLYPFFLLRSSVYDAVLILPWFDVYYLLNSLMVTLQFLHIYWAYLIYKVAVKANKSGKVEDSRSSSESSEED